MVSFQLKISLQTFFQSVFEGSTRLGKILAPNSEPIIIEVFYLPNTFLKFQRFSPRMGEVYNEFSENIRARASISTGVLSGSSYWPRHFQTFLTAHEKLFRFPLQKNLTPHMVLALDLG
jgi:hypothetical protein